MNSPILSFESITFHYPTNHRQVLAGFDMEIESGRTTAILGPNGAGKTTLLHLGMGWLKPDGGQILLNGRAIGSYSRRELGRWIGLVPQNEHLTFEYSLFEYTLLGRTPYLPPLAMPGKADLQAAYWALERAGLLNQAGKSVLRISGGERRLLLMARTLAQQPRLILMDEPTANLDLSNKMRLLEIIQALADEGISIVFTTHEPDFAAAAAANVVLMAEGRVLETGPLEKVFTTEAISRLYHSRVKVVDLDGQKMVAWRPGS